MCEPLLTELHARTSKLQDSVRSTRLECQLRLNPSNTENLDDKPAIEFTAREFTIQAIRLWEDLGRIQRTAMSWNGDVSDTLKKKFLTKPAQLLPEIADAIDEIEKLHSECKNLEIDVTSSNGTGEKFEQLLRFRDALREAQKDEQFDFRGLLLVAQEIRDYETKPEVHAEVEARSKELLGGFTHFSELINEKNESDSSEAD